LWALLQLLLLGGAAASRHGERSSQTKKGTPIVAVLTPDLKVGITPPFCGRAA